jgi:hypothetical protein
MVIDEARVEIIEVDGIEVESPGAMWVPRANVHPGISSHRGMTLVEVVRDGSPFIWVDSLQPGSAAYEAGLRVGDVISRVADRDLTVLPGYGVHNIRSMLNSMASFSVQRGGRRVDLTDECRARVEACRRLQNCPRHTVAYCCPL